MNKNDRIIWDSGFGYEVGHFIADVYINECSECSIDIESGQIPGAIRVYNKEVILYSPENIKKMIEKYKVEKTFSELF